MAFYTPNGVQLNVLKEGHAVMDWDIESTSVVMLGAGFSFAATDGTLPLMVGFFDRLTEAEFPELFAFVRDFGCNKKCEHIKDANIEQVLLALDQVRTSPARMVNNCLGIAAPNLKAVRLDLAMYTLSRLRGALEIPDGNWAAELLAASGPATTVVSMNYDNIAEQVLSNRPGMKHGSRNPTCPHCKMRLLLEIACSCGTRADDVGDGWRGSLLKPHGSIAWRRCINPSCCSCECIVADERCQTFEPCNCPHCSMPCTTVMVMPTMSKNLAETPEVATMWAATQRAIEEAESLLLFGFSFPKSDELLIQLVRAGCNRFRNLRRVASIDLEPEFVLDRFESCLPVGLDVELVPFPVLKGEVPIWFQTTRPGILAP